MGFLNNKGGSDSRAEFSITFSEAFARFFNSLKQEILILEHDAKSYLS